jgi:hypothetical protein
MSEQNRNSPYQSCEALPEVLFTVNNVVTYHLRYVTFEIGTNFLAKSVTLNAVESSAVVLEGQK